MSAISHEIILHREPVRLATDAGLIQMIAVWKFLSRNE